MNQIDYLHLLAANLRDPDERIRFIESTKAVLIIEDPLFIDIFCILPETRVLFDHTGQVE